jgi:hypothetical protein
MTNEIERDSVEGGGWRGGSMMAQSAFVQELRNL